MVDTSDWNHVEGTKLVDYSSGRIEIDKLSTD